MKRRGLWAVTGVGVVALIAIFFLLHSQAPPAPVTDSGEIASTAAVGAAGAAVSASTASSAQSPKSAPQRVASDAATPEVSAPMSQDAQDTMFKTDSSGRLITDEQARLNIEKLVALNDPPEVQRKVQELTQALPPAAAQQLPHLVDRYRDYSAALRQTVPPDQAPTSEQDAITMLETMHALRVQHFGKEVAEGFFASEEKMQRELIDLMRLQNDQSLSVQEKAEKAQALYQSKPELKARKEQR